MSEPNHPIPATTWVLAYEELRLILTLLKRQTLLGLEPDPDEEKTVAAAAYGLAVAERTLRARELARIGPDGRLQIALPLLEAIGTAALANQAIALHQVAPDADPARAVYDRLVLYRLGDRAATLTTPEPGLVRIMALPDLNAGLDLCVTAIFGARERASEPALSLSVSGAALAEARSAATRGAAAARPHLPAGPAGDALADFLAQGYRLNLVQVLDLLPGDTLAERQVSLALNDQGAWLMWQPTVDGPFELARTGSAAFRGTLASLTAAVQAPPLPGRAAGPIS